MAPMLLSPDLDSVTDAPIQMTALIGGLCSGPSGGSEQRFRESNNALDDHPSGGQFLLDDILIVVRCAHVSVLLYLGKPLCEFLVARCVHNADQHILGNSAKKWSEPAALCSKWW